MADEEELVDYDDDDDVEMADAQEEDEEETTDQLNIPAPVQGDGAAATNEVAVCGPPGSSSSSIQKNKKKKKKKKRKKRRSVNNKAPTTIADINRFVANTCRCLKEKKSYLVWNAVGCLGVSGVSDLLKEVDAIQRCGGQVTADGRRFRNGGGILWNILKSREPKAYKEIMSKGRELEKQFRQTRSKQWPSKSEGTSLQSTILPDVGADRLVENEVAPDDSEQLSDVQETSPSDTKNVRKPVLDRIRMPVAYDDLFEEGEIREAA